MPINDDELEKDQPKTGAKAHEKSVKPTRKTPIDRVTRVDRPKPAGADSPAASREPKVVSAADDLANYSAEPASASTSSDGGFAGRKDTKQTVIRIAAIVVAILALVILIFGILIYVYRSESPVVKSVAEIIPYPAERVNGEFVSYSDFLFEVNANEKAYQNNAKLNNQPAVDFKTAEGKKLVVQIKKHALDKLESDALIEQLAAQKNVKVSDKEVNDLINQLYQRYGGKDTLLKTLSQIYGWKIDDLRQVVRKQLLAKNLETKVTSDPSLDAQAKAKANDVLKKVKDNGDFSTLAKQYSQATDASSGGDLGFFAKGQLPDDEQKAAEALQPGQVSDTIKTQYGYEILKVLEKHDDGQIHAQHILIKTVDFNQYFQGQLKKAKVQKYITVS